MEIAKSRKSGRRTVRRGGRKGESVLPLFCFQNSHVTVLLHSRGEFPESGQAFLGFFGIEFMHGEARVDDEMVEHVRSVLPLPTLTRHMVFSRISTTCVGTARHMSKSLFVKLIS